LKEFKPLTKYCWKS